MWFRVGANGQLEVADPPAVTQGTLRLYSRNGQDRAVRLTPHLLAEKHEALRQQRRKERLALFTGGLRLTEPVILGLAAIALLGALIYGGVHWWSKPRPVSLPEELDQRAQLLVESWLKADTQTMTRLAHRNYRGPMRRWSFEHPSPLSPGKFDRGLAIIDVRIVRQDAETAEVETRIDLSGLTGAPEPIVMQQRWQCLDGTWVFKLGDELASAPQNMEPAPQNKRSRQ